MKQLAYSKTTLTKQATLSTVDKGGIYDGGGQGLHFHCLRTRSFPDHGGKLAEKTLAIHWEISSNLSCNLFNLSWDYASGFPL